MAMSFKVVLWDVHKYWCNVVTRGVGPVLTDVLPEFLLSI